MTFEEACLHIGCPSDRVALVKRNVELKAKLRSALNALDAFGEAWHLGKRHEGDYRNCTTELCEKMREVVRKIETDTPELLQKHG